MTGPKIRSQGTPLIGAVPNVPARKRGPNIGILRVPCPTCKAEVGDSCTTIGGVDGNGVKGKPTGHHPHRRRMAVRLSNEERFSQETVDLNSI